MPADIEELLSFLMYKKVSAETLKTLLNQTDQKLNTDLIKQILENNSKESINKLLKLFQQAPGGTQNTDQLKDILSLLSQITPKKDSTANDVLTNLTLLYLPWLPLSEKQDLEIKFEKREQQETDESEQTALVIYITTINLGRFKISIILKKDYSIKIEIEADCEQRLNENENKKEQLENILKEINKQTRKDKINASTELFICETGANEINSTSQKKREVIISPANDVSSVVVITAQKIAKIILETDEKFSLLERRKAALSS